MRKMVPAAIFGASVFALSTFAAQACTQVTPLGANGSMNIRTGPSLDYSVKNEVMSGLGEMNYCGEWEWDEDGNVDSYGNTFKWLHVFYALNGRVHSGWVASSVVAY